MIRGSRASVTLPKSVDMTARHPSPPPVMRQRRPALDARDAGNLPSTYCCLKKSVADMASRYIPEIIQREDVGAVVSGLSIIELAPRGAPARLLKKLLALNASLRRNNRLGRETPACRRW
jgi:hypothetical protein